MRTILPNEKGKLPSHQIIPHNRNNETEIAHKILRIHGFSYKIKSWRRDEEPEHPEVLVGTAKETIGESVTRILAKLIESDYFKPENQPEREQSNNN